MEGLHQSRSERKIKGFVGERVKEREERKGGRESNTCVILGLRIMHNLSVPMSAASQTTED